MEKLVRYSHCCYALCIFLLLLLSSSSSFSVSSSPLFSSHFAFYARCQPSLVLLGFAELTARISSFCLLRVCFPDKYISIIDCSSLSFASARLRSSRDNPVKSDVDDTHRCLRCDRAEKNILISAKAWKSRTSTAEEISGQGEKKETLRHSSRGCAGREQASSRRHRHSSRVNCRISFERSIAVNRRKED